jgi:hypothetical protein
MIRAVADETTARESKLVLFLESLGQDTWVYAGDVSSFVETLYAQWTRASRTYGPLPPPAPATDSVVFLSYSTKDAPAAVVAARCLQDRQLNVWYDRDRLVGGSHFNPEIAGAIQRCTFFVPILSRNTEDTSESYFREEWRLALERIRRQTGSSRRFVVPLVIDDLRAADLREVPPEFRDVTIQSAPGGLIPPDLIGRLVSDLRSLRSAVGGV